MIFEKSHLKFLKWKRQKSKNSIFDSLLIVKKLFHRLNSLLANQVLFILSIFNKPNVWYLWNSKILALNFAKILQGRQYLAEWPKKFNLLQNISFDRGFRKVVLSSLLLFSCCLLLSWSRKYSLKGSSNFNDP